MRERILDLPSGKMAALEYGDETTASHSVLFIHGWLDNAASFHTVMAALHYRQPNLHLLAIDLLGHGYSEHKSATNFYPFHDYIDDIYQLSRILSSNKPLLVGHSLGALIASCYSAAFPELVSGLIQIEGNGPLAESPENSVERLRQGVMSRQRYRQKPSRQLKSFDEALMLRCHANQLSVDLLAPIVARGTECRGEQWRWRHDSKLKCDSLYRMAGEHADRVKQRIQCPQTVILGESGYRELREDRRLLTENCPQVVEIPGGHHCHLEHPELIVDQILGLVNKI